MQQVTVRVPASTSNLGPGFDCLGVALQLYNFLSLRRGYSKGLSETVRDIAGKFFSLTRCRRLDFSCAISSDVPVARGLGGSATIRVGLFFALNELAETKLSRHEIFNAVAELEGHPDNAAPATFGGFTITRGALVQQFKVSSQLWFVLLVPEAAIETTRARALLPKNIAHADAVMSAGNAAAITAAFAAQKYENLRGHFFDGLHQPYRKPLVPYLHRTIQAAEKAGALGAFLSGSGSAICALSLKGAKEIGRTMLRASKLQKARVIITHADNRGARITQSNIKPQASHEVV